MTDPADRALQSLLSRGAWASARRRMRRVAAVFSAGSLLVLGSTLLAVCGSCRSVPDDTLENGGPGPLPERSFESLTAEAAALYDAQPRTAGAVRQSASLYDQAARLRTDDYDMLWRAARSCAWLGEYLEDSNERMEFTRRGLRYANTALLARPDAADQVEALFQHAVLSGLIGDLDHSFGLDAVKTIEEDCLKIIDSGGDVRHGGAHRLYGLVLLRAPGPPTSIGSLRNAKKQLEKALEAAPDWPENHLYMAELEFAWAEDKGKPEFAAAARARLERHLLGASAEAPEGWRFEFDLWRQKARRLLEDHPAGN